MIISYGIHPAGFIDHKIFQEEPQQINLKVNHTFLLSFQYSYFSVKTHPPNFGKCDLLEKITKN